MTEKEAKEFLKNGHSIEELIELFSDKQEQHDIYINSGLVYKDFDTIISALKNQLRVNTTE